FPDHRGVQVRGALSQEARGGQRAGEELARLGRRFHLRQVEDRSRWTRRRLEIVPQRQRAVVEAANLVAEEVPGGALVLHPAVQGGDGDGLAAAGAKAASMRHARPPSGRRSTAMTPAAAAGFSPVSTDKGMTNCSGSPWLNCTSTSATRRVSKGITSRTCSDDTFRPCARNQR